MSLKKVIDSFGGSQYKNECVLDSSLFLPSSYKVPFAMHFFVGFDEIMNVCLKKSLFVLPENDATLSWKIVSEPTICASSYRDILTRWLLCYFQGTDLPKIDMHMQVSPFTEAVLHGISQVPFAQTISYKELAYKLSIPQKMRALASACGRNPLPLIIPCHRVIASNGGIGGFSCDGGVELKKILLKLEKKISQVAGNLDNT